MGNKLVNKTYTRYTSDSEGRVITTHNKPDPELKKSSSGISKSGESNANHTTNNKLKNSTNTANVTTSTGQTSINNDLKNSSSLRSSTNKSTITSSTENIVKHAFKITNNESTVKYH